MGIERVSVVKCSNYDNNKVSNALKASLENIGFKFKKGMKVLIKPNLLMPCKIKDAITTNPVLLEELCKILKRKGCEIIIGDSSGQKTNITIEKCGILKLKKYGKVVNFEGVDKKIVFVNNLFRKVPLPKLLFDVDLIINFCKMKTHSFTGVTLSVKNLYGCISGSVKERYHKIARTKRRFSDFLVDLHEKIKPGLNLCDGIVGMEGNGPGPAGKPIKTGVLIASRNAYALDIVGSEIMGFDKKEILINKFALERKLVSKNIEIVGDGKGVRKKYEKPASEYAGAFLWLSTILPRGKISFDYKKCMKCHACEKKCPVEAIKLSPYPLCNHKKCISCLCCIEICPHKAVSIEEHWIRKLLRKMFEKIKSKK